MVVTEKMMRDAVFMAKNGMKIKAIKMIKDETGCKLFDAKQFVENINLEEFETRKLLAGKEKQLEKAIELLKRSRNVIKTMIPFDENESQVFGEINQFLGEVE